MPELYDIRKDRKGAMEIALQSAKYNDMILYHRGPFCAGFHKQDAMTFSEKGFVSLVQKKNGKSDFMYLAIRTRKRMK